MSLTTRTMFETKISENASICSAGNWLVVREHQRQLRKKKTHHTATYKICRMVSHVTPNTIIPLCNHMLTEGSVIARCDLDDSKL